MILILAPAAALSVALFALHLQTASRQLKPLPVPVRSGQPGPAAVGQQQLPHGALTPERFGAVGNGRHDDTHALQRAIDTAHGRPVWLAPRETYVVRHELRLRSGTTIEGAGSRSVLRFTWLNGQGRKSGGLAYIGTPATGALRGIELANFRIQGAGNGLPSGLNALNPKGLAHGIKLVNVDRFAITHVAVDHTPGYAIGVFGSRHGSITRDAVSYSGRGGIEVFWLRRNPTDITISGNTIAKVGDDAIGVVGALAAPAPANHGALPTRITITRNTITGWTRNVNGRMLGNGIAVYGVNGALLGHNTITNTYAAGIRVMGCTEHLCGPGLRAFDPRTNAPWESSNVRVIDNTISNAGGLYAGSNQGQTEPGSGIYVQSASGTTVSANRIDHARGPAVQSDQCQSCSIQRS